MKRIHTVRAIVLVATLAIIASVAATTAAAAGPVSRVDTRGAATPASKLTPTPALVDFGTLKFGTCTAVVDGRFDVNDPTCTIRTVTLRNTTDQVVTWGAIALPGASPIPFSLVGGTCAFVLQPRESCTVTVTAHAVQPGTGSVDLVVLECPEFACSGEESTVLARIPLQVRVAITRTPSFTGTTARLPNGDVVLFEDSGVAHRLRGVNAGITDQLVAFVGSRLTVFGTPDRFDIPNYPILVQDFKVVPGGALSGEVVVVTGQVRRIADGDITIDDQFGHGHRLRPTATVSAAQIEALIGQRVTLHGRAVVTNAASRTNWPIDVDSITLP